MGGGQLKASVLYHRPILYLNLGLTPVYVIMFTENTI